MKKLGKFQTLALVSLSSIVLAVPIVLAQTTGGDQNSQKPAGAEWHGRGKGGRGKGVPVGNPRPSTCPGGPLSPCPAPRTGPHPVRIRRPRTLPVSGASRAAMLGPL